MAAYTVNKERMNYSRLCRAVVDLCTDIYRDILHRRINPINLKTELSKCADISRFNSQDLSQIQNARGAGSYKDFDITLLYMIFRGLFTQDLRDALMTNVNQSQIYTAVQNCNALSSNPTTKLSKAEINATKHSVTTNSYNHLKDELLWKLHLHLCQVHPLTSLIHPTKLWGQDPDPGNITVGDDIERIRILRNTVYGHVKTTEICDADFVKHWNSLEDITVRVDNYLGTEYKNSLDEIRVSNLDMETEKKYLDQIKKLAEDLEKNKYETDIKVNTIKNAITRVADNQIKIGSDLTDLKNGIATVTEKQGELAGNLITVTEKQGEMASNLTTVTEKQDKMACNLTTVTEKQGELAGNLTTVTEKQGELAGNLTTVTEKQGELAGNLTTVTEKQDELAGNLTIVTEKQKEMAINLTTAIEKQDEMVGDITDTKTNLDTVVKDKIPQLKTEIDTMAANVKTLHKQTKGITTKLERDVGHLKSSFKDPVPEHLRERYNIQLKEWKGQDAVFVETRACNNVRKAIKKNTFVTVSGNAGSGKSAIIQHLALEFKSNGYDVLPVKGPDDINKYLQIDQKQLFVYDDPVGVHCLNRDKFIKWLEFKIESSEMTKNMKVLCSVRRQIVNEPDYKSYCNILNKTVVDIQDDENQLTLPEKIKMIRQHIEERQLKLSVTRRAEEIIDKQDDLFPLACKLYVSSNEIHKTNDWTFFQSPFKLILQDLEKMKLHDKVKYCILTLGLVSENSLNPELYTPDSTYQFTKENPFILACGLTRDSVLAGFENGVESLVNVYLKWQDGLLSLAHDLVSDVVSFHFGQKYPKLVLQFFPSKFIASRIVVGNFEAEDPYVIRLETKYIKYLLDRMLMDLEKRDFKNVFMNKCWRNDTFLHTLRKTFDSKISKKSGQIDYVVLDIFTKPQQLHEYKESNTYQMFHGNTAWYQYAMLLCFDMTGVTALHYIAAFGYIELFCYIWSNLSSVQKATVVSKLPLIHFACLGGEIDILNIVLQSEIDKINTPFDTKIDLYPVHLACFKNEDIIQNLIRLGANVSVRCLFESGKTVLSYAVGSNNIKCCSLLIHHGNEPGPCKYPGCTHEINDKNEYVNQNVPFQGIKLDLNVTEDDGVNLLHVAASNNSYDVAKLLLEHGADPNHCDNKNRSPLFLTGMFNSADVAKLLLQHGADPNQCDNDNCSPLYVAAIHNSVDVAKLLLQHGADPNQCDNDNCSPLYVAAIHNSVDVAKLLLQHGADPNLCDNDNCSPLYVAAIHNSVDVAKLLLQHGADPNLCDNDNCSPLYVAAIHNSVDVAKLLLQHGADPNLCDNDNCSPLYEAAIHNSADVAKLLLQHGADPNLCDNDNCSPLYEAAIHNSADVAKLLLQHGADLNQCDNDNCSPLYVAAIHNSADVAKFLLQHGADPNLCDNDNCSPLYEAAIHNSADVAKLLLQHGADLNPCDNDNLSPLYVAAICNSVDVAKLLLQHGADPNHCNNRNASPLYVAPIYNRADVAKLLLQHGADLNQCDNDNLSPLYVAAICNSVDVAKLLLQHGADPNQCDNDNCSPLYEAAIHNSADVAKLLLQHGADPNLCDNDNCSPLYEAAMHNSADVANLLLQHGADPNLYDNDRNSPLFEAVRWDHPDIEKLLLQYGANPDL